MKNGKVQGAFLGLTIQNADAGLAKKLNLNAISGVYIVDVNKNVAANKVGIRSGDVIIAIDDKKNKYEF